MMNVCCSGFTLKVLYPQVSVMLSRGGHVSVACVWWFSVTISLTVWLSAPAGRNEGSSVLGHGGARQTGGDGSFSCCPVEGPAASLRLTLFLLFFQNKSPLINENLKKCLNTKDGQLLLYYYCTLRYDMVSLLFIRPVKKHTVVLQVVLSLDRTSAVLKELTLVQGVTFRSVLNM